MGARGEKKSERKREKEIYQHAARLAGNYTAFVSDGAFNDLSTPKSCSKVLPTVRSAVRIRRRRAACCRAGKKRGATKRSERADRIESIESNSRFEFVGKVSGRRWNCPGRNPRNRAEKECSDDERRRTVEGTRDRSSMYLTVTWKWYSLRSPI